MEWKSEKPQSGWTSFSQWTDLLTWQIISKHTIIDNDKALCRKEGLELATWSHCQSNIVIRKKPPKKGETTANNLYKVWALCLWDTEGRYREIPGSIPASFTADRKCFIHSGKLVSSHTQPINTMSWALWIQSNIGNSYLFSVIFILLRIILYLSPLVEHDFIPPVPNVHGTIIPSSGEEAEVIFIQEIHYFSRFHLLPGIELVC